MNKLPRIEFAERRQLLVIICIISFTLLIIAPIRKYSAAINSSDVMLMEKNATVIKKIGIPFIPYFFGEQSAINRILTTENRISKSTDSIYNAAEERALSKLLKKIRLSIDDRVQNRVEESIRKSEFESIERNLAAALDDKKAQDEIVGRIGRLNERIQEFENKILAKVSIEIVRLQIFLNLSIGNLLQIYPTKNNDSARETGNADDDEVELFF